MPSKNVKGYAFEYLVKSILANSKFKTVVPDDMIIYENSVGLMIHGLGQPHNADVLVNPPVQIPFYFPSRLLVECKCYDEELGIECVRNVLGLREDINNFDIVTPEILRKRRNYRRQAPAIYDYERYSYQVALASISGFKKTALEFANVHRIPLITFKSSIFKNIVDLIIILDELNFAENEKSELVRFFKSGDFSDIHFALDIDVNVTEWFSKFEREVRILAEKMRIGLLENGTLLFLYKPEIEDYDIQNNFGDGYTLHWSREHSYWGLRENGVAKYYFELPREMIEIWGGQNAENARRHAIDLKENYFKKIIIYDKTRNDDVNIRIIKLSSNFIQDAINRLDDE